METDRTASAKITIKVHNKFSDMFTGTDCFKGSISLKVKEDTNSWQTPPRLYYKHYGNHLKSFKNYQNSRCWCC